MSKLSFVKKWYGQKLYKFASDKSARGLLSIMYGVVEHTNPELWKTGVRFKLQFENTETAFINMNVKDSDRFPVTIPLYALSETYYEKSGIQKRDIPAAMLGTLNGYAAHESLHAALTRNEGENDAGTPEERGNPDIDHKFAKKWGKLFFDAANIVEDCHIESRLIQSKSPHRLWVEYLRDFLSKQYDVDEILANAQLSPGMLLNIPLLYVFPQFRNLSFWGDSELFSKVKSLMQEIVSNNLSYSHRLDKADELLQILVDETEFDEEDFREDGEGGEDGEGEGESGEPSLESELGKAIRDALENGHSESLEKEWGITKDDLDSIESEIEENKKDLEREWRKIVCLAEGEADYNPTVKSAKDFKENRNDWDFEDDKIDTSAYRRIAETISILRTNKKKTGRAFRSGSQLNKTRLPMYRTSDRVFSKPRQKRVKDACVGVLIDLSASMCSNANGKFLISHVVKHAFAFHKELKQMRFRVFMAGHTTRTAKHSMTGDMTTRSLVVKIDHQSDERFMNRIETRSNMDGVAIEWMTKQFDFKKNNNVNILFVLSDGQPAAPRYSGALDHTRKAIEHARELGIQVWSISLVRAVVENNDKLYGEDRNLFGRNIGGAFERGFLKDIS